MRASDATPNSTVVGPFLLRLGLVYVGDPFAKVKVDLLLRADTLNAQKGGVVLLVPLGPDVSQDLRCKIVSLANEYTESCPPKLYFRHAIMPCPGKNESLKKPIDTCAFTNSLTRSPPPIVVLVIRGEKERGQQVQPFAAGQVHTFSLPPH